MQHFLWHCKVFKGWPLERRVKNVAAWELCPCCVVDKHLTATCSVSGRKRCVMAKHNNMLCPRDLVFWVNMVSNVDDVASPPLILNSNYSVHRWMRRSLSFFYNRQRCLLIEQIFHFKLSYRWVMMIAT